MQSRNPVFARAEGFNGRTQLPTATRPTRAARPRTPATATPRSGGPGRPGVPGTQVDQGRMTIDSVVQKTGITLAVVVLVGRGHLVHDR